MTPYLHHAALEVARDAAEGDARFWELLGFERVRPPEGLRDRALWLASGAQQVHLLFSEAPVAPRSGHVALHVEDFDAAVARMREGGFDVEARTPHWGVPRASVRSPAGHLVELMAAPPA